MTLLVPRPPAPPALPSPLHTTGEALITVLQRTLALWPEMQVTLTPQEGGTCVEALSPWAEVNVRLSRCGHLTDTYSGRPFELRGTRDVLAPFGMLARYRADSAEHVGAAWRQAALIAATSHVSGRVMLTAPLPWEGGVLACGRAAPGEVLTLWAAPQDGGAEVHLRVWKRGQVVAEHVTVTSLRPTTSLW